MTKDCKELTMRDFPSTNLFVGTHKFKRMYFGLNYSPVTFIRIFWTPVFFEIMSEGAHGKQSKQHSRQKN